VKEKDKKLMRTKSNSAKNATGGMQANAYGANSQLHS